MKRKFLQGAICGATVSALLFGTAAYATVGTNKIDVVFGNVKIRVGGGKVEGDTEPFSYKGRVYVPVRFVAEALGKVVDWDNDTHTVSIHTPGAQPLTARGGTLGPGMFSVRGDEGSADGTVIQDGVRVGPGAGEPGTYTIPVASSITFVRLEAHAYKVPNDSPHIGVTVLLNDGTRHQLPSLQLGTSPVSGNTILHASVQAMLPQGASAIEFSGIDREVLFNGTLYDREPTNQ